jgi:DNA-binding response OmpR family regulator
MLAQFLQESPQSPLGKASLFTQEKPLKKLSILIVESDHKLALVIKNILFGLGCQNATIAHDGIDALALLQEETFDIVIADWHLKQMGGLDLVSYLRNADNSPNRLMPVVVMSSLAGREHVEKARDTGADEYLLKPFAAKSLLARLFNLIEQPRGFVVAKNYIGPDRRRTRPAHSNDNAAIALERGRPFVDRKPAKIVTNKEEVHATMLSDMPRMLMPDFSLKKKLGLAVNEDSPLTDPSTPIKTPADTAVKWLLRETQELKNIYRILEAHPDKPERFVEHIEKISQMIATHAADFGYARGFQIATLLADFCKHYYDGGNRQHLKIIYGYIDALMTLFTRNIKGNGGKIGESLYNNLSDLMQCYRQGSH